ncbi:MAG: hypothetical protein EAZ97_10545 [Bacteroidetes bacterium]|nr:MAG: hypothetical protein EAZ97_10545 [Bacteroidota bacterium]
MNVKNIYLKFKKLQKWLKISIFLATFVAIYGIFVFYTNQILGAILQNLVESESKGLYALNYEYLHLNFFDKTLIIKNLSLTSDSLLAQKGVADKTSKHIFEAKISETKIKIEEVLPIYFHRQLKISGLSLQKPAFQLHTYQHEKQPKIQKSFRITDLENVIWEHLKVLHIKEFDMKNASFHVHHYQESKTHSYHIQNVNLDVDNLLLDSAARQNRQLFPTDILDLNIKDYVLFLDDRLHQLEIEEIGLSAQKSEIYFKNIHFFPQKDSKILLDSANNVNLYDILVPEIRIKGLDFAKLYGQEKIDIEKIIFQNPHIQIINQRQHQQKSKRNQTLKSILKYISSISIRELLLDSAKVEVIIDKKRQSELTFENISLLLQDFHLDSLTLQQNANHLYSKDLDLIIRDHVFYLPDQIHTLKAKEIGISTSQSMIYVNKLLLRSKQNTEKEKNLFNFNFPRLEIKGFDIWKAYTDQKFDIQEVKVADALFKFYSPAHKISQNSLNFIHIYPLLAPYAKKIKINRFEIENSSIELSKYRRNQVENFNLNHLNLILHNFLIDSLAHQNQNKIFYASDIEARLNDYIFDLPDSLHRLTIKDLYLSTKESLISLGASELRPKYENYSVWQSAMNLTFNGLELQGIDFFNAYLHKNFIADKLIIKEPNILGKLREKSLKNKQNLQTKGQAIEKWFNSLKINEIVLEKGNLKINKSKNQAFVAAKSFSAHLQNFSLDSEQKLGFKTQKMDFFAKNYTISLAKEKYLCEIKKISSANNFIHFDSIFVFPTKKNTDFWKISAFVPSIKLSELDWNEILYVKQMKINSLAIKNSDLKIFLEQNNFPKNKKNNLTLENWHFNLLKDFKSLTINNLDIDSLSFQIKDSVRKSLFSGKIQGKIENFYVDSLSKMTENNFLFSKNISLQLTDYQQCLNNQTIKLQSLSISSSSKSLEAAGLFFKNNHLQTQNWSAGFSDFSLKGINFFELYKHKNLIINELFLSKPLIFRLKNEFDSLKLNQKFDAYSLISPYLQKIEIKNILLNDLSFRRLQKNQNLELDHVYLSAKNFVLDSVSKKFWYSDSLRILMKDFSKSLANNSYELKAKEIGFIPSLSRLYIDSLQYFPKIPKENWHSFLGYNKGWLKMVTGQIVFDSLDWKSLFEQKSLIAKYLTINGINTEIYRDRRKGTSSMKARQTPFEMLKELSSLVRLDTVKVQNAALFYEEYRPKSIKSGKISFENTNGFLTNITNDSALIHRGLQTQIMLKTNLMGKALMTGKIRFPLNDPHGSYVFRGALGSMNLQDFNQLTEGLAFIRIKRGEAQSMQFSIKGNNDYAFGEMLFFYKKLQVSLMSRKEDKKGGILKGIAAFLANTFVVKSNNREPFARKGQMFFQKTPNMTIFSHWGRTFLSGVKTSLGVSRKKTQKLYEEALNESLELE